MESNALKMRGMKMHSSFVLISPVRNEEKYIKEAIESVISQTVLPIKWVIVNDGSTDGTNDVVKRYQKDHDFIDLIGIEHQEQRSLVSRVKAVHVGMRHVENLDFEFLGILDADITLPNNYYETILDKFHKDPKLGIAGGLVLDEYDGKIHNPRASNLNHVAGGIQFFRKECFQTVGPYAAPKWGGSDAIAENYARMRGWQVVCYPEMKVLHHRQTGIVGLNRFRVRFREGIADYTLGTHPLFFLVKSCRRIVWKPVIFSTVLMLFGYIWAFLRRYKRDVSKELISFLRKEQINRMKSIFKGI